MPIYTKSTIEEVQIILNTTSTRFPNLKYDQDKICTHCEKLDIPCVVLPEKFQEYHSNNYGYADYYKLRITHLDYHCGNSETRLPVLSSLLSHRTLFRVSFSLIEWIKSATKSFTKQETPQQLFGYKKHDSEAPVNRFRIVSKYVMVGFPKDRLVQTNIGIEDDRYFFLLYVEEDPRGFSQYLYGPRVDQ
jgi:hypothetical protein